MAIKRKISTTQSY